jgi:hypothetical protein
VRLVVVFPVRNYFLVYFFAYVVADVFVSPGHAVDVNLELLLRNFVAFLLLFVVVFEMLLRLAIFGVISKNRLLSMVIFKVKVIEPFVLLGSRLCLAQVGKVFE